MIRLAFVAEHYPPTDGGVATSTQRVARALCGRGMDVQVFCFDARVPIVSRDAIFEERDCSVRVKRVAPFFLKHKELEPEAVPDKVKATFRRRAVNQMIRELQKNPVDAVLSFYLLNSGFMAQFVARELNVPHLAGVRGNDVGRNIFHEGRFAAIQWVVQSADRIICVNKHLQSRLHLAFPEAAPRSIVIPNSIVPRSSKLTHEDSRTMILKEAGWSEDSVIYVFIGNFREKKGLLPCIDALEIIRDPRVRLLLVGPDIGSVERRMAGDKWCRLLNEGRVFLTQQVPRENVPDWIVGGDVILMPSIEDGMANALLEGMSFGLCPLVTDIFTDVVEDGVDGIVVAANDPTALRDSMDRLAADPELRRKLGCQASEKIRSEFQSSVEADRYIDLLQEVLDES